MLKKTVLWILTLSLMITIFAFSAQEATDSDETSLSFIEVFVRFFDADKSLSPAEIEKITQNLNFITRKGAHFSIYALLGLLIASLLGQYSIYGTRQLLWGVFLTFVYACTDEFHQTFVKGRACQLRDIGIDTLGALCGILFLFAVCALIKICKRRKSDGLFEKV